MPSSSLPPENDASEISLEACRRLLPSSARALSDAELESLRTGLYALGRFAVALVLDGSKGEPDLSSTSPDDRDAIEERAAVLQFDAKMLRSAATRAALLSHRATRRKGSRG